MADNVESEEIQARGSSLFFNTNDRNSKHRSRMSRWDPVVSRYNGKELAGGRISILAKAQAMLDNSRGLKSNVTGMLLLMIVSSFNVDNGFEQSIPINASVAEQRSRAYRGSDRIACRSRLSVDAERDIRWILVAMLTTLNAPPPAILVNASGVDDSTDRTSVLE